jgi:Kyakuja-Dileera-Zisupton transposase
MVYRRTLVADGNFTANHLKQKNADDDVFLTNGECFMTAAEPYEKHLKDAASREKKYWEVSDIWSPSLGIFWWPSWGHGAVSLISSSQPETCNKYRAIIDQNKGKVGYDRTGIGQHACARHGCFAPGSAVDFYVGEKYMHMDWSFCEALATTNLNGITDVMEIYDIICRYSIHLLDRVADSKYLELPDSIRLIKAIGLFHVHGHRDGCLYRFATSYVPGAGIVDGEVLETLWAVLNEVSRSTRTATLAHRAEIIDDHMGDSNWKKIINMGKLYVQKYNIVICWHHGEATTICSKFTKAVSGHQDSKGYFEDLTAAAPPEAVAVWKAEIELAEANRDSRVEAMDIMHTRIKKGDIAGCHVTYDLTSFGSSSDLEWDSTELDWKGFQIWKWLGANRLDCRRTSIRGNPVCILVSQTCPFWV